MTDNDFRLRNTQIRGNIDETEQNNVQHTLSHLEHAVNSHKNTKMASRIRSYLLILVSYVFRATKHETGAYICPVG